MFLPPWCWARKCKHFTVRSLIQLYSNNVTNLHQFTSQSTLTYKHIFAIFGLHGLKLRKFISIPYIGYFLPHGWKYTVINGYFPFVWTEIYKHIFAIFCPPRWNLSKFKPILVIFYPHKWKFTVKNGYFPCMRTEIYKLGIYSLFLQPHGRKFTFIFPYFLSGQLAAVHQMMPVV